MQGFAEVYSSAKQMGYSLGYEQGRADAYIECMRIVSECVWKDSEMLERMIAEKLKEHPNGD